MLTDTQDTKISSWTKWNGRPEEVVSFLTPKATKPDQCMWVGIIRVFQTLVGTKSTLGYLRFVILYFPTIA